MCLFALCPAAPSNQAPSACTAFLRALPRKARSFAHPTAGNVAVPRREPGNSAASRVTPPYLFGPA